MLFDSATRLREAAPLLTFKLGVVVDRELIVNQQAQQVVIHVRNSAR